MSAPVRWVQWSAAAAPSSQANWTPGPGPSWLAWTAEVEVLGGAGGEDRPGLVRVEGAGLDEDETPEGAEERPS
jgi:hypothetical protein